jgi:spore germination protein KA
MKRKSRRRRERTKEKKLQERSQKRLQDTVGDRKVSSDLEENIRFISQVLGDGADLITRKFTIQYAPDRQAALLYLDGMSNVPLLDNFVLRPMMLQGERVKNKTELWDLIFESLLQTGETKKQTEMRSMVESLLSGDAILFVDGCTEGAVIGAKGWQQRGVTDPKSESVIRGSREGFTENLRVNTALIRRRLKDPDLRMKNHKIGVRTNTNVSVMYIEGVVDDAVVKEVEDRLKSIEMDGILESGYIEEMIEDTHWTPFPGIQNTERPDAAVANLLEGKVCILVDGTPNVLIAPAVFSQFYASPEDYYERYLIATFLRGLRLVALLAALLLPALYIAFISFHPEMIPSKLAIAMAAGRASVPFPSIVEALVMEISVEILREASVRLPGPIGPTIGIVGALVIGEAAVSAGLVSPLMVIVVGLTTISSYANPSYNAAISVRLLRFPFMIIAAIFGLYGIMMSLMILLVHLIQLRSFGVPYMSPLAPLRITDVKDTLIRVPWPWMKKRPVTFRPGDDRREGET